MKNKNYWLQMFAEDPVNEPVQDPVNEPAQDPEPKNKKAKQEPKYTDDDIDKIIARKFAELEKKKQKEIDESARLAGMSEKEKADEEKRQMEEKLNKLMEEQQITKMMGVARGMLADKRITVNDDLLATMVSVDAEQTKSAIDSFAKAFRDAVDAEVKEALKGNVPKTGNKSGGVTKENIMNVADRTERQRLIEENMELFKN